MLRWRLLLGTLFIAILVGMFWLDASARLVCRRGDGCFHWRCSWRSSPAAKCCGCMAAGGGRAAVAWLVYLGNIAIVGINTVPLFRRPAEHSSVVERLGWPMAAFVVSVLIGFCGEMRRYERPGHSLARLALAILALAYVGLLLSITLQLRILRGDRAGVTAVASLIAVVKMGDTGAYTLGRMFGRHKMTPTLSPGKTWEGVRRQPFCLPHLLAGWYCGFYRARSADHRMLWVQSAIRSPLGAGLSTA